MDGYKSRATETGVMLSLDGREIPIEIPGFQALGIDPANDDTFHHYVQIDRVVGNSDLANPNLVWENLQEEPFPTFGLTDRADMVCEGGVSSVPLLGSVSHHVDQNNRAVVNITQPDHELYPGVVVRHLFAHEGALYIASVGIGNGDMGGLNSRLSDALWEANVGRITRESVFEDNQKPVQPLSPEAMHKALQGPMSEEFLTMHPEAAALKPWADASCDRQGMHYQRFLEVYDELKEQGSYSFLQESVAEHQQNMSQQLLSQPAPAVTIAPAMLPVQPVMSAPGFGP